MRNVFGHEMGTGSGPGQRHIGAALIGDKDHSELVSIDENGEIWKLAPRYGSVDRKTLVRYCIDRGITVYGSIAHLVQAMQSGSCMGLLAIMARSVASPWRSV